MAESRDEFVNCTQGWVGVHKIDRKGDESAVPVEPGARVFLTAEEQQLTAEAHRTPENSPFTEREIIHFDIRTGDVVERFVSAPLRKVEPEPKPASRRKQTAAVT